MNFDFDNITAVEMTVVRAGEDGEEMRRVVFKDQQFPNALKQMAVATKRPFVGDDEVPLFEVSETYPGFFPCTLPLASELADNVRPFRTATAQVDGAALNNPSTVSHYFVKFTDGNGETLIGVRRATQLKGVSKKKLLESVNDGVKMLSGNIMAVDKDFDYLIDDETVYIARPAAFLATGQVQEAVLAAAGGNADAIEDAIDFLDMDRLSTYGQAHPTGARLLASIRHRDDLADTSEDLLRAACVRAGVALEEDDGKWRPPEGKELAFLKVLDRRRYTVELVEGAVETFDAASRHEV